MAVSTIKAPTKAYKTTDIEFQFTQQTWSQSSTLWFCTVPNFTATGKILSVMITAWGALQGTPTVYVTGSTKVGVAMPTKPTQGYVWMRVVEEV